MSKKRVPKPPQYTQVPNDILDNLSAFSKGELKCYLAIIRATVGYHKRRKKMSLSYLQSITGLSKTSVISAIQSLMKQGLITRVHHENSFYYEPVFYEEDDDDDDAPKNGSKSGQGGEYEEGETVQILDRDGSKSGQKTVQNLDTLKEKEIKPIKKEHAGANAPAAADAAPSHSSKSKAEKSSPSKREVVTPWGVVDPDALDENKRRILNAMQEGYAKARGSAHGLASDFPEHLRPLAAWCVAKCGKPKKGKKADWIKSLNTFYDWGATPEDMEEAFARAYRLGYRVTRPGSLEKFVNQVVNERKYGSRAYTLGVEDPLADEAPPLDDEFDF